MILIGQRKLSRTILFLNRQTIAAQTQPTPINSLRIILTQTGDKKTLIRGYSELLIIDDNIKKDKKLLERLSKA
jgi:hypothetical protein